MSVRSGPMHPPPSDSRRNRSPADGPAQTLLAGLPVNLTLLLAGASQGRKIGVSGAIAAVRRSVPLLQNGNESCISAFTASRHRAGFPGRRAGIAGSQSGFGNVASRSSSMPFDFRKGCAASPRTSRAPTTAGFAPASTRERKVSRTAEPALMTSSTIATLLPSISGATVSGRR